MTKAEVFRAFSRKESPSAADGDRAILWLKQLKGLGFPKYKEEKDCIFFLSDCFSWFTDQREAFATATAEEVEFSVKERFKEYLKAVKEAAEPKVGMPWRAESLPVEKNSSNLVKKGRITNVNWWNELKKVSRAELADDIRLTKETDFAQFLQRLKERDDKEAKLHLLLIQETLRENAKCSRKDLALEEALRFRDMKRNPRIRSLTCKKSRLQK